MHPCTAVFVAISHLCSPVLTHAHLPAFLVCLGSADEGCHAARALPEAVVVHKAARAGNTVHCLHCFCRV